MYCLEDLVGHLCSDQAQQVIGPNKSVTIYFVVCDFSTKLRLGSTFTMSSSEESDSDISSNGGEDEAKMRAMLSEWDNKDTSENNDVYVDSDDSDNEDAVASQKMQALRSKSNQTDDGDDDDDDDSDEELAKPTTKAKANVVEDDDDDDDNDEEYEEEVIDDDEEEEDEEEDEDDEEEEEEEEEEEDEGGEIVAYEAPTKNKSKKASDDGDEEDDERDVVDDGNIEDTLKKKPKKKKEKKKIAPITAITPDDTEEDAAMKALLSEWVGDDVEADDANDDDDDDEDSDASEREVKLEDNVIDHIVLAAPDLEEAMTQFEKMTGIAPKVAGSINGLGIKCARISFNDSSYIEIIAPDPKQAGPIGQLLKAQGIKELTPFHFAIRSSRAEDLKDEVKQFGYVPDHITMFGGQKDGTPKKWEMLFLYGHKMGGVCPYFINWANSDHPCATLPVVGKLKKFTIRAPEEDPVHKLFDHVDVKGFNIEVGKSKLSFQFSSPEGTIKFATSKAVGFKFPGFDDDENDLDGAVSDDDDAVFDNPDAPELLEVNDNNYEALPPPVY
jgi:hypothetical protein